MEDKNFNTDKYIYEILTPVEAAKILKCDPKTIYGLMDQRKITYIKVGKNRRIKKKDLQKFIDNISVREARNEKN